MDETPETRYAQGGVGHVAYQVIGLGPPDLVFVHGVSHVEAQWQEPHYARFLRQLASFSRLILFDMRGVGLSDPVTLSALPTLEEWADDVSTVLDAVGSQRAVLFGTLDGGPMSIYFAAAHPARTSSLVLVDTWGRTLKASDYPWGLSTDEARAFDDAVARQWGVGESGFPSNCASLDRDPRFREWWLRYQRLAASPGTALAIARTSVEHDVRHVLPTVNVPTLVIQRDGHPRALGMGRFLAEHITGATYVELAGEDQWPWAGDADAVLDEMEEFLTGVRRGPDSDRVLATILFTDIVGSTEQAARMGDRNWRRLLDDHDRTVRDQFKRFGGREVNTTGDGFIAAFDGPARAVRCGTAIVDALGPDLEVRVGVHTGECEARGSDLGGVAVHIAARVAASASPGTVFVSSTVRDLVAGSGISFRDLGNHELRGVPGAWRLLAVE